MQTVNFAGANCCPQQPSAASTTRARYNGMSSRNARQMQFGFFDPVTAGAVCCCGCALPVAAVGGLAIWKGGGLFKKAFGGIQKVFKFFADLVEKFGMGKIADAATK